MWRGAQAMSYAMKIDPTLDVSVSATKELLSLGPRLARVAMNVPEGGRLVDVGTDHARLPIALVKSGRCSTAIGIELRPGPFDRARRAIAAAMMSHRIVVREGHGLDPIEANEADVGVLAGFGGRTAKEVIQRAVERDVVLPTLVLQVNRDLFALRGALAPAGYRIAHEELVYDDGRVFVIIVAVPGTESLDDDDRWLGPLLRKDRSPLFVALLRSRRDHLRKLGTLEPRSEAELASVEKALGSS